MCSSANCRDEGLVRVLYDGEVGCRADIDRMESAIRNARSTSSSSDRLSLGANRCGILETAAYTGMRLSLLRWIADLDANGEDAFESKTQLRCHIGSGISVVCSWGRPPKVCISWRHSDNDGTLPVATATTSGKKQPRMDLGDDNSDDDVGCSSAYKRGSSSRGSNSHAIPGSSSGRAPAYNTKKCKTATRKM